MAAKLRADHTGPQRSTYEKHKQYILKTQEVCGICGKPVDKSLKYPHPMSATIDHIIPVSLGGHPSDLSNLQLSHFCCNRQKSDKLLNRSKDNQAASEEVISNRLLPQAIDWAAYRSKGN